MSAHTSQRPLKELLREVRAGLILDVAEELFAEKGYHETSMDEIAARAGVAKGTLYQHFPSKQDLVVALFERELEAFQGTLTQVCASAVPARTKLERLFEHVYSGFPGQRLQLMLSLFTNIDVRKDLFEKKDRMRSRMEDVAARLSTVIEEGKAAGEFTSSISTPVLLNTLFLFLSPHAYRYVLEGGQLTLEELVTQLRHIFFQGIAMSTIRPPTV